MRTAVAIALGMGVALAPIGARAQTPPPPPSSPPPPPPAPTDGAASSTAPTSPGAAAAPPAMTMEEAVNLALATNERAKKAPLRVEAAEGSLERARAAFLPTIVAGGSGQYHDPADRTGRNLTGSGSVTLNQSIVNLSSFPLYASAKHSLESERWGAVEDKRTLAYDTAHAYLVALTDERLLIAAQQRLDRARANQADSAARAEAGLTSTNDVTRASIDTATAVTQVVQAQSALDRAYIALEFLVGRGVKGPLIVPDRTTRAARQGAFRMDEVIRFAETQRPDVQSMKYKTESLRASAEEPLYRLAPTLGASANVHAVVAPEPTDVPRDETVSLTLTWTIYDGGVRYADRKTRVAQAESQALDEQLLRRSIATDVSTAIVTLRAARDAYKASQDGVDAAAKSAEETQILYKQGLARAIEVTDANGALYDAQVSLESANLTMWQAYLGLRQALGLQPIGDDLQGGAGPGPAGPSSSPVTTGTAAPGGGK